MLREGETTQNPTSPSSHPSGFSAEFSNSPEQRKERENTTSNCTWEYYCTPPHVNLRSVHLSTVVRWKDSSSMYQHAKSKSKPKADAMCASVFGPSSKSTQSSVNKIIAPCQIVWRSVSVTGSFNYSSKQWMIDVGRWWIKPTIRKLASFLFHSNITYYIKLKKTSH